MIDEAQEVRSRTAPTAPPVATRSPGALAASVVRRGVAGGIYRRAWARFRRNRVAIVAGVLLLAVVLFVLGAGVIAAITGHTHLEGDIRNTFRPPFTPGYLLGTDGNGRDLLVRLAYGGRVSLLVASVAGLGTLLIGGLIGVVAGYFGGVTDSLLMRLVDILLCLPGLSLLILISTVLEAGPLGLALVIAAVGWAGLARLIRGDVMALRRRDYVEAARLLGASDRRIIVRHILPNIMPLIIVWVSLAIPSFILSEATLSFLNLGVKIPTPSWGNMLQNAREFYVRSWANVVFPGLMIYITVLAINLVGSGLRDALDPRLSD